MTFLSAFFLIKIIEFWFRFHWNLFLGVQLPISQQLFRQWLGVKQAISNNQSQRWPSSLTPICSTRRRWIKQKFCKSWPHLSWNIFQSCQGRLKKINTWKRYGIMKIAVQCLVITSHKQHGQNTYHTIPILPKLPILEVKILAISNRIL